MAAELEKVILTTTEKVGVLLDKDRRRHGRDKSSELVYVAMEYLALRAEYPEEVERIYRRQLARYGVDRIEQLTPNKRRFQFKIESALYRMIEEERARLLEEETKRRQAPTKEEAFWPKTRHWNYMILVVFGAKDDGGEGHLINITEEWIINVYEPGEMELKRRAS